MNSEEVKVSASRMILVYMRCLRAFESMRNYGQFFLLVTLLQYAAKRSIIKKIYYADERIIKSRKQDGNMRMMTAQQAAEKWNTSVRNVQDLCKRGRISGAERWGSAWMIPDNASRPADARRKENKIKEQSGNSSLIRKSPFLDMTDLYNTPGTADAVIGSLADHPEAQQLFAAEIAYSRGEIDKVYRLATYFLERRSGFYAMLSGGMLLGLVAMWKGDVSLWQKAKKYMYEAPW